MAWQAPSGCLMLQLSTDELQRHLFLAVCWWLLGGRSSWNECGCVCLSKKLLLSLGTALGERAGPRTSLMAENLTVAEG
jgi:hypothetical protein